MLSSFRSARKCVHMTLVFFFLSVLHSQAVQADIVTTDALLHEVRADNLKQELSSALDRDDVLDLLQSHGVSAEQAQERVAAMTDAEAAQLAAQFDDLPAGGTVALLLVVIILVLLLR